MCNIETQPIYLVEIVEWEASGIIIDCYPAVMMTTW